MEKLYKCLNGKHIEMTTQEADAMRAYWAKTKKENVLVEEGLAKKKADRELLKTKLGLSEEEMKILQNE